MLVPPLLSVALVFRSRPEFDSITHIIDFVSSYVDSSVEKPLHKACKFNSVTLLDRIWSSTVDLEPSGRDLWSVRKLLRENKLYGKFQFTLCLLEAAKLNSVDIARWLFDRFPYGVRRKVIYEAAKAGALEILQFFRANGTTINFEEEDIGADGEWDEEREDWERGRYIHFGDYDAAEAILAGYNDVAEWLYEGYRENSREKKRRQRDHCRLAQLAQWMMAQMGFESERFHALHQAATAGHTTTLQWFQDSDIYTEIDSGALIPAAEAGQLEVVQWMLDRDQNDDKLNNEDDTGAVNVPRKRCKLLTYLGGEASLAIHTAAINGHLEIAKLLHAKIDKPRNEEEKDTELRRRIQQTHELSRDYERGCSPKEPIREVSRETMMLAAERGFLDVVKWLYTQYHADPMNLFWVCGQLNENGFSTTIDVNCDVQSTFCSVVDTAACNGHLEIVQYLLQVGGQVEEERTPKRRCIDTFTDLGSRLEMPVKAGFTTAAMDIAAAHGHLGIVQWLRANCSEGCTTAAMDLAAEHGHLEDVKWLHANRKEGCTSDAMNGASARGHLHVVKWLHEYTTEGCTTDAMDNAAGGGHLEVLKWLHENRTEGCTVDAMDSVAGNGNFDMVKWLHNHGAECTTEAMDRAANRGRLRVLRWLFENRKEGFTSKAMQDTTRYGHFETALILHNIVQQGLVKDVKVMNVEQSAVWIAEYYAKMAGRYWTPGWL
ncbi:putative ankyrin repeat protein [Phytophthora citrophthora]|uniref:Ankyrin repeat protein n=1 Tax=Phytophthora citrophthora TaxID=4793 RepID=A0AAD9GBN4_9STRA|nr:putative ankyrin repeat protein [Phytophthora citrophthora]